MKSILWRRASVQGLLVLAGALSFYVPPATAETKVGNTANKASGAAGKASGAASKASGAADKASGGADAPSAPLTESKTSTASDPPKSGQYDVKCAYAVQIGLTAWITNQWRLQSNTETASSSQPAVAASSVDKNSTELATGKKAPHPADQHYMTTATCPSEEPWRTIFERTIAGGGDLVVVVAADQYDAAVKSKGSAPFTLFINGVDQGSDAALVSAETNADRTSVGLLFRVASGKVSQALWTRLYDEKSLTAEEPLSASLGWRGEPIFSEKRNPPEGTQTYISVTNTLAMVLAFALGALLLLFFWWSLKCTDAFRDAPSPSFYSTAVTLRRQIYAAVEPKTSMLGFRRWTFDYQLNANQEIAVAALVAKIAPQAAAFSQGNRALYEAAAAALLDSFTLPTAANIDTTIVSLALQKKYKRPLRLSYSLARVQFGMWMAFATFAAVFLWVVYGSFPVLEGSVLALVAVSTITSGASSLIGVNNQTPPTLSQGFIRDMMTSADGMQQAHRYQALVVNVLLLCVGIVYVVQHLAYPTFDTAWLGLLTLSGVAQTAGKQILET